MNIYHLDDIPDDLKGYFRPVPQIGLEPTPEEYVAAMVGVFREVRRVLRDDGTLWLNLGDSYCTSPRGNRPGDISTSSLTNPYRQDRIVRGSKQETNDGSNFGGPNRMREYGLKHKDLVGIPWRVAFALQADGWYLRSDIIWCLSGGTRVYARTQKGEAPMTVKDLVRLQPETVELWSGEKWTKVLGWNAVEGSEAESLELELRTGERIGCTVAHEWPTQRGLVRADALQVGDIIQTCQLPAPERPKRPDLLPDALVGWFVGLYIAEGSRSGEVIQIASHADDLDRFERLKVIAAALDGTCARHPTSEHGATINLHGPAIAGVLDTYISGRTADDKHLGTRCWRRSNEFIASVLKGYLDGDGHFDGYNNRWRLGFTENDNLAGDLRTICARIGATIRLRRTFHKLGERRFPGYRGEIRFERSGHHNEKPDGQVVAIRESRARRFWDIGVSGDPHLFALASGVLTHNSKPNPMPESVTDRPTKAHEYLFLLSKSARYYYDAEAIKEPATYAGKVVTLGAKSLSRAEGRNRRSVWTIASEPYPEAHFATFPPDLVKPCVLAGSRPGDLVGDPFVGAGTVPFVAQELERRSLGVDLNPAYLALAVKRLRQGVLGSLGVDLNPAYLALAVKRLRQGVLALEFPRP